MTMLLALALASAARLVVGSAFLYAGASKLRDLQAARLAVLDYRAVPASLAMLTAIAIGGLEVVVGLGLILGLQATAALGILLLAGLTAVAFFALARGFDMDCHCGGAQEKLSIGTLQRNAMFALALLLVDRARFPGQERVLIMPHARR